jgi:hypothetical protein
MAKQEFEQPLAHSRETIEEIKEFQVEWQKEIEALKNILANPALHKDEQARLRGDLEALEKLLVDSKIEERKLNAQNN